MSLLKFRRELFEKSWKSVRIHLPILRHEASLCRENVVRHFPNANENFEYVGN